MMTTTIYHNPKCSKSRETKAILEQKADDLVVIDYLKTPPNADELKILLTELALSARQLMRQNEAEYKMQNLDDKRLSENELIQAMVKTPKLIERPIVRNKNGALIARPPERVLQIL